MNNQKVWSDVGIAYGILKYKENLSRLENIEFTGNDELDIKLTAYIEADAGRSGDGPSGDDFIAKAVDCQNRGADRIVITDLTEDGSQRDVFFDKARELSRNIDIPFLIGITAKRFEDVKKAFYTGAEAVIVNLGNLSDRSILKESADRFGEDSVFEWAAGCALSMSGKKLFISGYGESDEGAGSGNDMVSGKHGISNDDTKTVSLSEFIADKRDSETNIRIETIFAAGMFDNADIMSVKREIAEKGLKVNTFSGKIDLDELKTDANGLIPCIAQDYKTGEVLMLAYMNAESYEQTLKTGIMTYYSRSRQELWVKGATSGHYQYVRELKADCDKDTLLAKVVQIGAACHTGSRTCFFNDIVKHDYLNKDISAVLRDLYDVVCDRKKNPKEGSYTNYLFNKGIDKILKKCGEEATEMVIAAKNPSHEELKYEIADLLYHMTVLMVECGVNWEEVATELANR
ncbi:MAG: bifunctional phosphoribosyl-AMP cyclohydrolase/phosphoribosyl-ATP diphosphatase HisIE [Lachnospiraceae bacterium]|nr:bifunctional phosphoribosyl-AMP cyclohydrolase/phosphoribosyl-ATP diphosphatase HisIE [Lachnospiraceae bacterium]